MIQCLAGDEGFEPPNARTRTWCLTAWPIPITNVNYIFFGKIILVFWSLDQNPCPKYLSGDKFRGLASAPPRFRPCRLPPAIFTLPLGQSTVKFLRNFRRSRSATLQVSQMNIIHLTDIALQKFTELFHPSQSVPPWARSGFRPCKLPLAVFTHYGCKL